MTHVLIDRATLEQLVVELQRMSNACELEGDNHRNGDKWYRLCDDADKALTAGRAALANAEPTGCTWTKDPDFEMGDTYDSSCGEKWSFIDGGPTENRVSFCQGCGKPVKIVQDTL